MTELRRVVREFLALAAMGLVIGVAANAANPNGLSLTRNYFGGPPSPPPPGPMTEEQMVQRLKDRGFQALFHSEVLDIFNSPYRTDGVYVFVDARSDGLYQTGHIPGAYQLDHYYRDRHLDTVLEACKVADKIVVYCNGGECEDSELAVGDLLEKGVPAERLYIYAAGFTKWHAESSDYEIGDRDSGQVTSAPATGRPTAQGARK